MKRESARKKCSIRWLFFVYCLILVFIMLAVVWTMRLLFVNSTYQQVRTSIAEKTSKELSDVIASGKDFQSYADEISENSDTSIALLDGEGNIVHLSNSEYKGYKLTSKELSDIRDWTIDESNGTYVDEVDENNKILIYSKAVTIGNELTGIGPVKAGTGVIVLTCSIEPMEMTVKTINLELAIVTIIMIVFALVISYFLARHISKPIIDISNNSSKLAKGDYSVRFSEDGYREVSELGETLNYTTKELGRADRMRRDLIANVSHDLRTPLTMIRGYVEMMRDIPNENNVENMNVILKETDYLTKLVKDMLDISKLESNVIKFSTTDFDLNALLVDVRDRYNAMYKQQGYTFIYEPYDEPKWVNSDKVMLTNVLYNLINNAINHIGEDKKIYIETEMNNGRMTVHVIDHGEGIEESKLETIWDRYYKAERNLKRESAGSGLGLSIVKTILTKLGSGYGVKSKVNEGSDFYFDIAILPNHEDSSEE